MDKENFIQIVDVNTSYLTSRVDAMNTDDHPQMSSHHTVDQNANDPSSRLHTKTASLTQTSHAFAPCRVKWSPPNVQHIDTFIG
jgi:hypothetical protein